MRHLSWTRRLTGFALAVATAGLLALTPMAAQTAHAQDNAAAAENAAAPAAAPAAATAAPAAAPGVIKAPPQTIDKGDVTWMMVSTVLVLLMTIPGLALFYGGLVRQKNMLSMLMQVSTVTIIGMIAWVFWGYSLAFTDGGGMNTFVGGFSRLFMNGVTTDTKDVAATFSTGVYLPEMVFVMFQMTFAAITAALVVGSMAERLKFSASVVFAVVWPVIVYYPIAHMVWFWGGPDAVATHMSDPVKNSGLSYGFGALDFAGGTVVHINAGIAAFIGCLLLGKRAGYGKEPMPPHSLTLTLVGAGLLWVGWFGFNAGSNLEANSYAVLALTNTFVATAAAGLSWCIVEKLTRGKASMLGLASGLVAGLVAVTPAAGFAGPIGAVILGFVVSPVCVFFCTVVKNTFKYDDSLDVFGVHCIGGIVGALGTGLLVNPAWGGAGIVDYVNCSKDGMVLASCPSATYDLVGQMISQIKAVLVTLVWSGVGSTVVWLGIKYTIGMRATPEAEEDGLDIAEHGERAYHS